MAAYNGWQNDSIFSAAATLSDAARKEDRGAFFSSIHQTLNHVLWGDQFWLHRLANGPEPKVQGIPKSKDQYPEWDGLVAARKSTDNFISAWALELNEHELDGEVSWFSAARNLELRRSKRALIVQLFNHGTHHRGQVHAMLTAAGAKLQDTDVHFIPAERYDWS